MTAQHSKSVFFGFLAALALLAGFGTAAPASADSGQWQMSQPHWWDNSNGWRQHHQWRSQHQWSNQQQWSNQWHRRSQFNNGFHQCFGSCFGSRIIVNGSHVFFVSPGLVGNPAFIVRQPAFIVRQPVFIVRQPAFIIGGPGFTVQTARQRAFITRHPSLQSDQPMHRHHSGIHFITPGMHHSGVRIVTPGM
jgi:hypothetical protein